MKKRKNAPKPVTLEQLLADYNKGRKGETSLVVTIPDAVLERIKRIGKDARCSRNATINVLLAAALDIL